MKTKHLQKDKVTKMNKLCESNRKKKKKESSKMIPPVLAGPVNSFQS